PHRWGTGLAVPHPAIALPLTTPLLRRRPAPWTTRLRWRPMTAATGNRRYDLGPTIEITPVDCPGTGVVQPNDTRNKSLRLYFRYRRSAVGRFEIVRRDRLEELLELLHLVLAFVGHHQARLVEHRLLGIDRATHTQRDGHRIRRPRRDPQIVLEHQIGVERALFQVHDPDLFERVPEFGDHDLDQIVGQRAHRGHPLLFEHDGRGLGLPDPDGQVPLPGHLPEQQHRLVLWLLDADADHTHFTHATASHNRRPPGPNAAEHAVIRV